MIDNTGENLHIMICAEYEQYSDWMSFSACYSIKKNLPSAKIVIVCSRPRNFTFSLFDWASKLGVRVMFIKTPAWVAPGNVPRETNTPSPFGRVDSFVVAQDLGIPYFLVITPDVVVTRDLSAEVVDVLNNPDISFVSNKIDETDLGQVWFVRDPHSLLGLWLDAWAKIKSPRGIDNLEDDIIKLIYSEKNCAVIPNLCVDCQDTFIASFAHIKEQCGDFCKKEWKTDSPFRHIEEFFNDDMSVNEIRILELWKKMKLLFDNLKG